MYLVAEKYCFKKAFGNFFGNCTRSFGENQLKLVGFLCTKKKLFKYLRTCEVKNPKNRRQSNMLYRYNFMYPYMKSFIW
jgi:hypothetical protein